MHMCSGMHGTDANLEAISFILAHGPGYQLPLELAGNQFCSIYTDFSSDSSTFSQKHLHAFEHDKIRGTGEKEREDINQSQPNKFKAKVCKGQ